MVWLLSPSWYSFVHSCAEALWQTYRPDHYMYKLPDQSHALAVRPCIGKHTCQYSPNRILILLTNYRFTMVLMYDYSVVVHIIVVNHSWTKACLSFPKFSINSIGNATTRVPLCIVLSLWYLKLCFSHLIESQIL